MKVVQAATEVSWPWWARPWIAVKILAGVRMKVHVEVATSEHPGVVTVSGHRLEWKPWRPWRRSK